MEFLDFHSITCKVEKRSCIQLFPQLKLFNVKRIWMSASGRKTKSSSSLKEDKMFSSLALLSPQLSVISNVDSGRTLCKLFLVVPGGPNYSEHWNTISNYANTAQSSHLRTQTSPQQKLWRGGGRPMWSLADCCVGDWHGQIRLEKQTSLSTPTIFSHNTLHGTRR